jgi:hypothetical protein
LYDSSGLQNLEASTPRNQTQYRFNDKRNTTFGSEVAAPLRLIPDPHREIVVQKQTPAPEKTLWAHSGNYSDHQATI